MNTGWAEELQSVPNLDTQLKLLSRRERRLVLRELLLDGDPFEVADVLDEETAESEQVTYEHDHLPKLESAGYIEWNRLTGQIARGPQFREIVPLLELLEEHADELPTDWP